jgi:hypothetical protein
LVVDPCIRAWSFDDAESDSIRELVLDLRWVEYRIDQGQCLALDLDLEIEIDLEIDLDADLDFDGEMEVMIVEQKVDHRLERLEYVGVSLLTAVVEKAFDCLADGSFGRLQTFDYLAVGSAARSETFDYLAAGSGGHLETFVPLAVAVGSTGIDDPVVRPWIEEVSDLD